MKIYQHCTKFSGSKRTESCALKCAQFISIIRAVFYSRGFELVESITNKPLFGTHVTV